MEYNAPITELADATAAIAIVVCSCRSYLAASLLWTEKEVKAQQRPRGSSRTDPGGGLFMDMFTTDIDAVRDVKPFRLGNLVKNSLRGLCIVVFIFGAILFLQAHKNANALRSTVQSIDVSDAEPAQPFTVEYVTTSIGTDGTVTVIGRTTRYVKADGEWRLELHRNTAKPGSPEAFGETMVYAGTAGGVFKKENNAESLSYVSQSDDQTTLHSYRSGNYLRHHPEFFRMDEVAGLDVYVFRVEIRDAAQPGYWMEISRSPRTGITPLRTVRHSSDGSETRQEAVAVVFKNVPEDLNKDVKALPIRSKEK